MYHRPRVGVLVFVCMSARELIERFPVLSDVIVPDGRPW